jgi:hypothetical protein
MFGERRRPRRIAAAEIGGRILRQNSLSREAVSQIAPQIAFPESRSDLCCLQSLADFAALVQAALLN